MSRKSGAMMDSMQAHLRRMRGLSAGAMVKMLPIHRRMVADLLAQMTTDMYSTHMPADVAWTATMDSLQQDLIQLPELTKPELEQAMAAHRARLSRIITMHKEMIEKMTAMPK